jgi:hypothetical protein
MLSVSPFGVGKAIGSLFMSKEAYMEKWTSFRTHALFLFILTFYR